MYVQVYQSKDIKYLEEHLSDGGEDCKNFVFQRQVIEKARENQYRVSLTNCSVQRNRQSELEVLVSSKTNLQKKN